MEHSTSAVNWQPTNHAKAPGQTIRDSLAHVARGADTDRLLPVAASRGPGRRSSTQRRRAARGRRQRPLPRGRASSVAVAGRLGEVVGSRVESRRRDPAWTTRPSGPPRARACRAPSSTPLTAAHAVHRAAARPRGHGRRRAPVAPTSRHTPSSSCRTLYLVTDEHAAAVAAAAEAGAQVLVTFFSGISDENDHVRLGGYPGAFRDLLGVRVEEFFPLVPGRDRRPRRGHRHAVERGRHRRRAPRCSTGMPRAPSPAAPRSPVARHRQRRSCVVPQHAARRRDPRRPARRGARRRRRRARRRRPSPRRRGGPPQRRDPAPGSSCSTTRTRRTHVSASGYDLVADRPCRRHRPPRRRVPSPSQGGLTMLASQRRVSHPRASSRSRAPCEVSDLVDQPRRLRHDDPPRHRAPADRRAASSASTAARSRVGDARSSEEPGFTAKSPLHARRRSSAIAQAAAAARRARRGHRHLRRHDDLRVRPRRRATSRTSPWSPTPCPSRSCCTSPARPARPSCSPAACAPRPTPSSARSPSRRCARCTSTGSSSACTASTRGPA